MPIQPTTRSTNLLEVLERILENGVVIAGDIKIMLADVDLLTIKIRLLVASVDKAKEIGMDWWESDPYYSSKRKIVEKENTLLLERIDRLEQLIEKKSLPLQIGDKGFEAKDGIVLQETIEKAVSEVSNETVSQALEMKESGSAKSGKEKDSQNKNGRKKEHKGKHEDK